MIFITTPESERPLFTGYVNRIWERQITNGSKIPMFMVGTREKKQDGTKQYSEWRCDLIGKARHKNEEDPIREGDYIQVYGVKMTNISRKKEDGTWDKPFFRIAITDYIISHKGAAGSDIDVGEDLAY